MSEPHSTPKTWAKACGGWTHEFFMMRVFQCDSIKHLKRAIEYEKQHSNRGDRLTTLSDQLHTTIETASEPEIREAIKREADKQTPDKEYIGILNTELHS